MFAAFAALCALLGLLARAVYLYQFSTSPLCDVALGPDVQEYAAWANRIVAGETLWTSVHIHSPLYPYFLASLFWLFSGDVRSLCDIRALQLMLGMLCAIPICAAIALSARSTGDETQTEPNLDAEETDAEDASESTRGNWDATAPVFIFLWACYPPLIYYFGELTSEVLLVPLISMSIFFLYRWETPRRDGKKRSVANAVFAGLFAGLAVVTHPLSIFFLTGEAIYLLIAGRMRAEKKRANAELEEPNDDGQDNGKTPEKRGNHVLSALKPFAVFLVPAVLPIALVAYRNIVVLDGDAPLQANSGFNLYLGNGPEADGTCRLRPGPEWDAFHARAEEEAEKRGISKDRYLMGKTFEHIADKPGEWLALLGKKALYAWNNDEITAGADLHPLRYYTPFQRAFPWAFGICALLALTALFHHIADKDFLHKHRHFIILTLAFFVAQSLLVASGRYRVGALPGILVLAAACVNTILHTLARPTRRAFSMLPAVALAAVVVFVPSPPYDADREMGEASGIMGEALLRKGDLDNAEKCLMAAMSKQPKWSRNHTLMGLLMEKKNQPLKAKLYYLNAVKFAPDDPEGYANLATVCGEEGDAKHAATLYKKALSLEKPSPTLYYNYALFKADSGDIRTAAEYYLKCLEIDPANPKALNNLAVIEIQVGNPGAAVNLLETAVRLNPRNASRMMNYAFALMLDGKKGKAKKILRKCLELGVGRERTKSLEAKTEEGKTEKQKTPAQLPQIP